MKIKKITCLLLSVVILVSSFAIFAHAESGKIVLYHDDYGKSYLYAVRENGNIMKARKGQYVVWKVRNDIGEAKLKISSDGSLAYVTYPKPGWVTVYALLYNNGNDTPIFSAKTDLYAHSNNIIMDLILYYGGAYISPFIGFFADTVEYSTKKS